ncbi:MAG TPA: fluoride efflux transporter CrcB [Burkholderiaceae bacterium]|nr:fluoride efflux transporter CrcB [Burkholderiaceae bacterium]
MNGAALAAVFVGAGIGACLRFAFTLAWNRVWPTLPLGTLAANLVGGYLIGLALGFFAWRSDLSPLWRLCVITGFLGGLTTFSTFSAEVVDALARGDLAGGALIVAMHLAGSLALTALGVATARWWWPVAALA